MGEYVLSLSKLFLGNHIFPWLPLNSIFFLLLTNEQTLFSMFNY